MKIDLTLNGKRYTGDVTEVTVTPTPTPPPVTPPVTPPVVNDPPGTIILAQPSQAVRLTLNPGGVAHFKFTIPPGGCNTGFGYVQVNLVSDSVTGGDGQLLVKSSNQKKASWPTVDDYMYEFKRVGYVPGVDWERDPNGGVFFWTFTHGGAGENVNIKNAAAYGRAFNQADTYYVLLLNAGVAANGYRISWRCF